MRPPPDHHASSRRVYVLTLWQETDGSPWRAALRAAGQPERIGFADLEALAHFLLRLDEDCPTNNATGGAATRLDGS